MGTGERPSTSENDTLTDGWLNPPPPETSQNPTTPDLSTKNPEASTTVSNSGDAATTAIAKVIVTDEPLKPAAQPQQPVQPQAPTQSLLIDPAARKPLITRSGDTVRMPPEVKALANGAPPTSNTSDSVGPHGTMPRISPWSKSTPAVAQSEAPQPSKPARNPLQGAKTVLRIIPHAGKPPETAPDEKPTQDKIPKNPILRTRTAVAVAAIAALTTVLYAERKAFETPSKPDISATTPSAKVPNSADAGIDSGTVTKQATPSASANQAPIDSANVAPSVTAPTTSATTTPKTKPPRTSIQRNPNAHTGDGDDNIHRVDVVNPWKK